MIGKTLGHYQMIVVSSEKERDKYFNADGSDNEIGKAANKCRSYCLTAIFGSR